MSCRWQTSLGPRPELPRGGSAPAGRITRLLVGFEAGILGGLFAVPIAGVLWVLVSAVHHHFVATQPVTELAIGVGGPRKRRQSLSLGLITVQQAGWSPDRNRVFGGEDGVRIESQSCLSG